MQSIYHIEGTKHFVHASNQVLLRNPNHFPNFQKKLEEFKNLVSNLVASNKSATFIHFGDGDYYFHREDPKGSARPGKRALSVPYNKLDMNRFREGWLACDYHCIEYLEVGAIPKLIKLYPRVVPNTIPTEFLYGLTMNKWFFKTFAGKIGLIGSGNKLNVIKELMKHKVYQDYLGLENFNDYIRIPERFACDNLDNTIEMVRKQLEQANPSTCIYLYGVGHVKSGLIHELPKIKNAVYLDVGAGIDAIAGLIEPERPYAYGWHNHRLKNYDYSHIDLLQYRVNEDRNLKIIN
mgnify:CR=1 FL=1|jgi:hypothetical protein